MKKEFEVKCCYNCKECDLGKYCARLCSNIKEYGQLANDKISSVRLFNEKFLKNSKLRKSIVVINSIANLLNTLLLLTK